MHGKAIGMASGGLGHPAATFLAYGGWGSFKTTIASNNEPGVLVVCEVLAGGIKLVSLNCPLAQ